MKRSPNSTCRRSRSRRWLRAAAASAAMLACLAFSGTAGATPVVLLLNSGTQGQGTTPGPMFLTTCNTNTTTAEAPCNFVANGQFEDSFDVATGDFDNDSVEEIGVLMRSDSGNDLIVRVISADAVPLGDITLDEPARPAPVEYVDLSFVHAVPEATVIAPQFIATHFGPSGDELVSDVYSRTGAFIRTIHHAPVDGFVDISVNHYDGTTLEAEFVILHDPAPFNGFMDVKVVDYQGTVGAQIELNLPVSSFDTQGFSTGNIHSPIADLPIELVVEAEFGSGPGLYFFDKNGVFLGDRPTSLPNNAGRRYAGVAMLPCTNCADGSQCFGDADGDGLFDTWELQGLDANCDGTVDLDLPNMNADPLHKDIYVEFDWTIDGTQPTQAAMRAAKTLFATAPDRNGGTTNADQRPGINLWIDTGNLMDPFGLEPVGPASCSDGIDNDGDGLPDMEDDDCQWNYGLEGVGGLNSCSDGIDDNGDGLTDAADPTCNPALNREAPFGVPAAYPAVPPPAGVLGGNCGDGIDNDGDLLTDAADPNCAGTQFLSEGAGRCNDGIDNDGDGLTDAAGGDTDCLVADNFGGGGPINLNVLAPGGLRTDLRDGRFIRAKEGLDAAGNPIPSAASFDAFAREHVFHYAIASIGFDTRFGEAGPASEGAGAGSDSCQDGVDNDGNGFIDFQDPACRTCVDNVDNDGDGSVDAGACSFNLGGIGEVRGNDFIVFNQGGGNQAFVPWLTGPDAGTFVHELGHNLGFGHGGIVGGAADGSNCKPHYVSAMNYNYQFGIRQTVPAQVQDVDRDGILGSPGDAGRIIDFWPPRHLDAANAIRRSSASVTLVETQLNEASLIDIDDTSNLIRFFDPVFNAAVDRIAVGGTDSSFPPDGIPETDWNNDNLVSTSSTYDIDSSGALVNPAGPAACSTNIGITPQSLVAEPDWENMVTEFRETLNFSDQGEQSDESGMTEAEDRRIERLANATSLTLSAHAASTTATELVLDVQVENLGPHRSGNTQFSTELPAGVELTDSSVPCQTEAPGRRLLCQLGQASVDDILGFSLTFDVSTADSCDLDLFAENFYDITGQSQTTVTLECNRPPTAVICESEIVAECAGETSEVDLDGTCSFDAETAAEDLEYEWTSSAGSIDPSDGATPTGSFALGEQSVELVVTDESGLESEPAHGSVEIVDTIPPVIVLAGEAEMTLECAVDIYEEPGASAVDVCDPNVPVAIGGDAVDVAETGQYVVTYDGLDDSGNAATAERRVNVVDTIPPSLSVSLSPTILTPPNHRLFEIAANVSASDLCDPAPVVELVSVVATEGDNVIGDGNTTNDIQIVGGVVSVRAERSGSDTGRIYTFTYRATDASGNVTEATAEVSVPHN